MKNNFGWKEEDTQPNWMLIRIKVDGQKVSKWKSGRSNNFKTSTVLKFRNERSRTGDNQNSSKLNDLN